MECPTCGALIVPNAAIRFDDEAGFIVGNGHVAHFSEKQMTIIIMLRDAYPRKVSREQFFDSMYKTTADEPDFKIIDVFICHIKKKIKGIGIDILTIWGQGYRLVYQEQGDG